MRANTLGLTTVLGTALALCACEGPHPRGPGGGTVQTHFSGIYVANQDHGTVTRMTVDNGAWSKIQVGSEPTRISRADDRVYVTNRADRTVSVLQDDDTQLRAIGTIQTGAEPFGVVATKDRVYVSASTKGEIVEYDAVTYETLRSWTVEGEPRGLVLHPTGRSLVGVTAYGGKWFHIDLTSSELSMLELPKSFGFDFETGTEFELTRRITGDPAFSPSGDRVAVPVLYVDNTSPIFDPNDDADPGEARRPPGGDGYQNRMNPGIVVTPVDPAGRPIDTEGVAVSVSSFVVVMENGFNQGRIVNAFPVAVAFTPDAEIALVALTGADVVVALDISEDQGIAQPSNRAGADSAEPGFGVPGPASSFRFVPNVTVRTSAGPVGLAVMDDDRAYVHALFDNTVEKIDIEAIRNALDPNGGETNPGLGAARVPPGGGDVPVGELTQLSTIDIRRIEANILSPSVDRGRRLFFSATNRTMAADGAGVSCSTCHLDGRNDGLTWTFGRGLRQTPSLAGNVSRSEPVGWQGDRPTVAEDAMMTSQGLMGGQGLTDADTQDIQAFVNSTRDVDNPWADGDIDAISRGKAIFERPDVACAACHSGEVYSNNAVVAMFELSAAKVRPLNGVALSAPYFHDGSAPTLMDVLERARDGSMGNTSSLSDQEMRDLERYLKSL